MNDLALLKARLLVSGVSIRIEGEQNIVVKRLDHIPHTIFLPGNMAVEVRKNNSSSFDLVIAKEKAWIHDKIRDLNIPVQVQKKPDWYSVPVGEYTLGDIIQVTGRDRLSITPFEGCGFFRGGLQCRFCGQTGRKNSVFPLATLDNFYSIWKRRWDSLKDKIANALSFVRWPAGPHKHLMYSTGATIVPDNSWRIALIVSETLDSVLSLSKLDSNLVLDAPLDETLIKDAWERGWRVLHINTEVFDKRKFAKICPGKHERGGQALIFSRLKQAVRIFGPGNVRSNFVLGLEPIESALKGAELLATWGVAPSATVFWPKRRSLMRSHKPPTLREVVKFYQELGDIYRRYGLRPVYCMQSSRSSLENEAFLHMLG